MKYMNAAKKFGAGAVGAVGSTYALAAPDADSITTAINEVGTTIDTVGGAMITLFIGMMVFAVIIGMVARKGK